MKIKIGSSQAFHKSENKLNFYARKQIIRKGPNGTSKRDGHSTEYSNIFGWLYDGMKS